MELIKQVCSLESAKRLKELGVKQESLFGWKQSYTRKSGEYKKDSKWYLQYSGSFDYSAFTVAELGEMLPQIIKMKGIKYQLFCSVAMDKQWFVVYANEEDYHDNAPIKIIMTHSEAEARAKMLIYLLENNIINNKQGNE